MFSSMNKQFGHFTCINLALSPIFDSLVFASSLSTVSNTSITKSDGTTFSEGHAKNSSRCRRVNTSREVALEPGVSPGDVDRPFNFIAIVFFHSRYRYPRLRPRRYYTTIPYYYDVYYDDQQNEIIRRAGKLGERGNIPVLRLARVRDTTCKRINGRERRGFLRKRRALVSLCLSLSLFFIMFAQVTTR